jgi:hypothetical protein
MSYDLMVFAPDLAPAKMRGPFLDWYDQQSEWEEAHGYDDAAVSTPALRAFYDELVGNFPALKEDDDGDGDGDGGTDYTIGTAVIYMSFPWDKVDEAHAAVIKLAGKHAVGFFDVSSDIAETWLPDGKGGLYIAHSD